VNRVLRKTALIYLSEGITIVDMLLYWKIDLLHIFNVIKDIMRDFIKYVSKTMM